MCGDGKCQEQHEAILAELKFHTHKQLDQLAAAVLGPIVYGDEHDTAKGLKAGQERLEKDIATVKQEVNKLGNGKGVKVKLPWSFYGTIIVLQGVPHDPLPIRRC
jgi:hypothetical protein